jgi:hypothetical protein
MTTNEGIDWKGMYEKLEDNVNFFKPKAGVNYTVTFLDHGGPTYEREWEGKVKLTQDYQVKVTGGDLQEAAVTWSLTLGGKTGICGRLYRLFAYWQGINKPVQGSTVHIRCDGEGKSRKYNIAEEFEIK